MWVVGFRYYTEINWLIVCQHSNPQPTTHNLQPKKNATMTFEQAKRFQKIFQWVRFLILIFFIAVLYFVLASAALQ